MKQFLLTFLRSTQGGLALKPILKPTPPFFLTLAAFAGLAVPGLASSLSPATISTSLTQCETQTGGPCVDSPTASYNGNLSGFSTETVGTGAFLSAAGFSSPILTSSVPTSVANAIVDGNLQYLIEVVGASGTVSLGVNSIGSISIDTTGPSNNANLFSLVQLELLSDESGTAVFNDEASVVYSANLSNSVCTTSNASTMSGVATVSASPACGGSTASGGFNETNSYNIQANALYLVVMQADLSIGTDNGSNLSAPTNGTVEGLATVDPIFTVPNGYTLELSSGVGNSASSVPEPGTWVLLASGMLLLFATSRANRAGAPGR